MGRYKDGKFWHIKSRGGDDTFFSVVHYPKLHEEGREIGHHAAKRGKMLPLQTVQQAKRLIGLKFSDEMAKASIASGRWPMQIVAKDDELGYCEFVLNDGKMEKRVDSVEVATAILAFMKERAEAFLGETVSGAVITCPAYFQTCQRAATKAAGEAAGLEVHRVINEPTAAALQFFHENALVLEKNTLVLIFDCGGGTFDATLLEIDQNKNVSSRGS